MANNLFEYYKGQGQALPSVQQRQSVAAAAGISGYRGTADQNTKLLSYLKTQGSTAVSPIKETSPVISSKDSAQGFQQDSTKLDGYSNGLAANNDPKKEATKEITPNATGEQNAAGKIETTGDPILDKLNQWEVGEQARLKVESEAKKQEYEKLYKTSLAAIDATAQSTINRITVSFDKRLKEQERINQLDIGRVKAYGLGGGGRFTPVAFGDAITNREREAADKMTGLEAERDSLIQMAMTARDEGQAKLLSQRLADLDKVDESIRAQLREVEAESERQYKLLRQIRLDEETKHKEKMAKMVASLTSIAPMYLDEYEGMDDKGKDEFIQNLAKQTGLDYATIYGIMRGASTSAADEAYNKQKRELDLKKGEVDIRKGEADIIQSRAAAGASAASAAASYALAAQRRNKPQGDLSESEQLAADTADMAKELKSVRGKDDYVSPADYKKALDAWVGEGGSAKKFHEQFSNYRNPKNSGYHTDDD